MKRILTAVGMWWVACTAMAQQSGTMLNGVVIESNQTPVEAATVSLLKAKDSSLVKIALSDKTGKYVFTLVQPGDFIMKVSAVNFETVFTPTFTVKADAPTLTIETPVLQRMVRNLSGVVVTSKKPLIEQQIDRMVVNVEAAVTNVGSTALEVLEKMPGVAVDKDGNISLKGKSSVMVMIDGKPSYLSGAELANLLGNMNAVQISQIEIMSNPSAKFDAVGNGGIINIKTKKGTTQGLNGSLSLNYGQGVYAKTSNSLSLNYRTSRFNTFLNYAYTLNDGFMNFDIQRNFFTSGIKTSELNQRSNRINHNQNNTLKLGLDYFLNSKTTIGLATSGFMAPQQQNGFTTSNVKDGAANTSNIEHTIRTVDNHWKNGTANINFRTVIDSGRGELSGNIDYLHYDFSGNQIVNGFTYSPDLLLLATSNVKNVLPLNINILSGRLDYAKQINNGPRLEAGIKASRVRTNNVADFFHQAGGKWSTDSLLSNAFAYAENIRAAYLNLNQQLGKWTLQAGLRFENTVYEGTQSALSQKKDSVFKRNYSNLFPTVFISYQASESNRFALSVGRRIDRPAYQELNPFISFIDRYTYSTGNPFLQPQFSNNIELSHTYKGKLTTTVNYSVIHDMMNETLIHRDSVIIRSVGNIGTRINYGIATSGVFEWSKWYSTTLFANLYENKYNGTINGLPFTASQLTLSLNMSNQFTFANGWTAELSGNYSTRSREEGQAIVLPVGQLSAGVAKQLFNNKANIRLNVRDMLYTQNPREIQNFQDVQSTLHITRDTRVFNIGLVYRFGKAAKPRQPANTPTDEQQRVKLN